MQERSRNRWSALAAGLLVVVFLAIVNWTSDPRPTVGQPDPPPPPLRLLFVIDSSPNMFPWDGTDYFQLAKDGIAEVLADPQFPANGAYEVGVIQFCEIRETEVDGQTVLVGAPGYVGAQPGTAGTVHWFAPRTIGAENDRTEVLDWVQSLEPCRHSTQSLIDVGLRAANVLATPVFGSASHVVLISTGEYRLPEPCPPDCYNYDESLGGDCLGGSFGSWACESDEFDFACMTTLDPTRNCSRVCQARYYADELRDSGVTISSLHVGPDWHNRYCLQGDAESAFPYGSSPGYCGTPADDLPAWTQPDRAGFLNELARTHDADGAPCTAPDGSRYARVDPLVNFGCNCCTADGAGEIAQTLKTWICDWGGDEEASGGLADTDDDGRPNLCDNCLTVANPRQRDCNGDGIGDACQQAAASCGAGTNDADDDDGDGLCNGLDTCPGGDDCLIRYWMSQDPALSCGNCDDLSTCGCDCNDNGAADLCEAAQDYAGQTLPSLDYDANGNGVADCAEGTMSECVPIPVACDLRLLPGGEFVSNFDDLNEEETVTEYLQRKRFMWIGNPSALEISTGEGSEYDDPYSFPCAVNTGYITLDPSTGGDSPKLLSPEFVVPLAPSCSPCRDEFIGANYACSLLGEYTFVSVSIEFYYPDADATGSWHVVVTDECNDPSSTERVHLRLTPRNYSIIRSDTSSEHLGTLWCGVSNDTCDGGALSSGIWNALRITMNHAYGYESVESDLTTVSCDRGNPVGNSVSVTQHRCSSSSVSQKTMAESRYTAGAPIHWRTGRLGLQIYPDGSDSGVLTVGRIRIAVADGCEYWGPENYPCDEAEVCRCSGGDIWECGSPSVSRCVYDEIWE